MYFSGKLDLVSHENTLTPPHVGTRPRTGWPASSFSTEPSILAARTRAALEVSIHGKTVRRYKKLAMIPKRDQVRDTVEQFVMRAGASLKKGEGL
jgi:hypothetical protein